MSGIDRVVTAMLGQHGHMFGWVPVRLAVGIGIYFFLRFEPVTPLYVGAGIFGGTGLLFAKRFGEVLSPIVIGICLVGIWFSIAAWRTHSLEAPVLGWRYYGAIEERIIGMDRSASDAVRITLDQVRLDRVPPSRTPQKIRISLHEKAAQGIPPLPGMRVMTTGHLSPPSGLVEPGGFDFQRHAWFGQWFGGCGRRLETVGVSNPYDNFCAHTGGYKRGRWWFCGSCYNWGSQWNEPSGIG